LPLCQIQKIPDHATVKLTADLYAHHVREIVEQASNEMQARFGTS
jgi:hypothetical protein